MAIDGDGAGISAQSIAVTATDSSKILADAGAVAVAVGIGGAVGAAISVGVSLAHNTIATETTAVIRNADDVRAGGAVVVAAQDDSSIRATSVAAAVSLGLGGSGGVAVAGGGAESTNVILTKTNAFIENSGVGTAANKVGSVTVTAKSAATIDAMVGAVAASGAAGGGGGVAVGIGIAVARNFIGWTPTGTPITADFSSHDTPSRLDTGKKVRIASGPMAGEVFEYLGATVVDGNPDQNGNQPIDLSTEDFSDNRLWKHVSLLSLPVEIQAEVLNSSIQSAGGVTLDAKADQAIDSLVFAGSMAVAGGGGAGVGVGGAGVHAENRIASLVTAGIDGDGAIQLTDGITAGSVTIHAVDSSTINAVAAAASIASPYAGSTRR